MCYIVIFKFLYCYITTIIITEETEYGEDFEFIHILKGILTADYLFLQRNSKIQNIIFTRWALVGS